MKIVPIDEYSHYMVISGVDEIWLYTHKIASEPTCARCGRKIKSNSLYMYSVGSSGLTSIICDNCLKKILKESSHE